MSKKILIVVTHLLGSGHLSRALTLGRSFAQNGHESHVVSGGFPAPHLDSTGATLHQLPPLRSDGTDFSNLLTPDGRTATPEYRAGRQANLLQILEDVAPDVLITELFPFGRRNLKEEFTALLEAAAQPNGPKIFASIRDILAPPSKPAKAEFAEEMVNTFYDGVLVHSDPALIPLEQSWPVSPALAGKLKYTGFVAPKLPNDTTQDGSGEVLVSAGGGNVGDQLYHAALDAAKEDGGRWRLLVGGSNAKERITIFKARAPENANIEPARPDFRAMLRHARASISLCGYNTAMDILQTGIPAVITPFDDGGEVEQSLRTEALQTQPGIEGVTSAELSGLSLLSALHRAESSKPRRKFAFDGAVETVNICIGALS